MKWKEGIAMEYILIFSLMLITVVPIVLYGFFVTAKAICEEKKVLNGVRNQDVFSQFYLFGVNYSKEEFFNKLNRANAYDVLKYTFDIDSMTLTFLDFTQRFSYKLSVNEVDGACYVVLKKAILISGKTSSTVPLKINEFMIKKFEAVPLPYDKYKHILTYPTNQS